MVPASGAGGMVWRTLTVADRTAHYGSGGSGSPVVFLHGCGLTGRSYVRALEGLIATGHRVYAPSLPGFGGTASLADRELSVAGYARWVEQFMRSMGIDGPVTLIGHSFGGGVAIRLARDFPRLVERLVLVNSIGGETWSHQGDAVRQMRERPLWDWLLQLPADLLPVHRIPTVLPSVLRDLVPNFLRDPASVWHAGRVARVADLTFDLTVLKHRNVPVVVVWSDQDTVIPVASASALREALGDPYYVTVPGKHAWLIADPQRFADLIADLPTPDRRRSNAA